MSNVPSHASPARRRLWPWIVGAIALALFALAALSLWDAWKLREAADRLELYAGAAQQAVSERDAPTLASTVGDMQAAADDFASHTDGFHWTVAGWIPWVKDQTIPLRQAGSSVQAVADHALGPLAAMDDLAALEAPPIENGRIDPLVLEPFREPLADAADVLSHEHAQLTNVSLANTVNMVREPFESLASQVATMGDLVQGAHVAAELLPPMLGAEGERNYIVMVQNNAEPRASGGIPGAVLQLQVDDGRMTFTDYVPSTAMMTRGDPVAPLTDDEERLFTERMAWYPQDVNFTPEYPRAAELMAAFWERETGEAPQAVISVDPVAFQQMLGGMEPLEVEGITLTDENLVEVLINEVYFEFEEQETQDAFFALASVQLFQQLVSGSTSAMSGVESAIEQGRFMVWSANAQEQALLETTDIAGDFLSRERDLGVFVNDGSGSKIGFYIDSDLSVVNYFCESDGSLIRQVITYDLEHTYPEAAQELPAYFSGNGLYVPEGEFHANVLVVPPVHMGVTEITHAGRASAVKTEQLRDRLIASTRIVLMPGESTTVEYEVTARQRGLSVGDVVQTPGPRLDSENLKIASETDPC